MPSKGEKLLPELSYEEATELMAALDKVIAPLVAMGLDEDRPVLAAAKVTIAVAVAATVAVAAALAIAVAVVAIAVRGSTNRVTS